MAYPPIPKGFFSGRLIAPNLLLLPNGEKQPIGNLGFQYKIGDIIAVDLESNSSLLLAPALEKPKLFSKNHIFLKWLGFLKSIRNFFENQGFLEVLTPTLVQSSGAETHLDPLTTEFQGQTYYLPTSPEFHLKKLISKGLNRIFEIKPCFRKDFPSKTHSHEFTMLEWYRGYSNLSGIIEDVKNLLQEIANQSQTEVVTMQDLFREHLGFILTPETSIEDLKSLCPNPQTNDSFSDVFYKIFLQKIEPQIGMTHPLIVCDFPPQLSALARINENGWAHRFEVYWRGLEIANAYDELNDPIECEQRLKQWNQEKIALGKTPVPFSKELLSALRCGFPPSAGIALGLERLFMAIHNISDINQIKEI